MKDNLITFETAKLAKEKGFDIETDLSYTTVKECLLSENMPYNHNKHLNRNAAPTQSLLQRWLREKHEIDVDVTRNMEEGKEMFFYVKVTDMRTKGTIQTPIATLWSADHKHYGQTDFNEKYSYGQALERGLQEALKLR